MDRTQDKSFTTAENSALTPSALETALNLTPSTPDTSSSGLPSLRQFLSEHLQHRDHLDPSAPSSASPSVPGAKPVPDERPQETEHFSVLLTPFEVFARGEQPLIQTGQQLNQLDTEMAAGLEHMLPTPSFRFKVMRNRIANELMILEAKLEQYRQIVNPPAGLLAKIASLEQRRATLKLHDEEVAFRQRAITVQAPWWIRFARTGQKAGAQGLKGLGGFLSKILETCSPLTVARKSNPMQMQLVELNQQLTTLANVLDTELTEQGSAGMKDLDDVSSMLRQYEQLVRRGNRLGQVMSNRSGLMDKANNWLQAHMRYWLTYWQG